MRTLFGKTLKELQEITGELGLPSYTAKQLTDWLYKKQVDSLEKMSNISQKNRDLLQEHFALGVSSPSGKQSSQDGTLKYLFPAGNGKSIESVYIPEQDRATLCISSQVGCKMGCVFCMTGKQGFQGNLTAGEIVNQVRSLPEKDKLTNLVYMGMGEPMDNLEEVMKSLEIFTSDWGYGYSPSRITVSSIGKLPALKTFLDQSRCHLAISLHASDNNIRNSLMPMEKAFPMAEIVQLIRQYDWSHQRRISFEYILFRGINDTLIHARNLHLLLQGIPCRINLISFHEIPGVEVKGSERNTMEAFKDYLNKKGLLTTLRKSRGEDILAACGLLSTERNRS